MRGAVPQHSGRLQATFQGAFFRTRDLATPGQLVGGVLLLTAIGTDLVAWAAERPVPLASTDEALLLMLTAAVGASYWFPIRIGKRTHLYLASIPLYLLCALYAPAVGMTAIGIGLATRELTICRRCNNTPGQVAGQIGRWMLLSFIVSSVVRLWPADYLLFAGALAGVMLWLGDVWTSPLVVLSGPGEGGVRKILRLMRQSYAGELMQYLIGLLTLGLLGPGSGLLGLVYVPSIILSVVLLYLYLKAADEMSQSSPALAGEAPAEEQSFRL